MSKKIFIRYS